MRDAGGLFGGEARARSVMVALQELELGTAGLGARGDPPRLVRGASGPPPTAVYVPCDRTAREDSWPGSSTRAECQLDSCCGSRSLCDPFVLPSS
jgi:hypothetical protein